MSEITDVVQGTIQQVMERVDALAAKLGIAAGEIWRFTVTAKVVEAKRDFAKCFALVFLTAFLWGWALHVLTMKLPHEVVSLQREETSQSIAKCVNGFWNGGDRTKKPVPIEGTCYVSSSKPVEFKDDHGLKEGAWMYIASGIASAIIGLLVLLTAVGGMIDAKASEHTAEYDGFQDLLCDLKD